MEKVPYFNETERFVHIGDVTIPPDQTRSVDPRLLPGYSQPESGNEACTATDPLQAISAMSVGKLESGLPALSDDELVRLEDIEKAKAKPRQGALAAITAERLRRAEQAAPGGVSDVAGDGTSPTTGEEVKAEGGEG